MGETWRANDTPTERNHRERVPQSLAVGLTKTPAHPVAARPAAAAAAPEPAGSGTIARHNSDSRRMQHTDPRLR